MNSRLLDATRQRVLLCDGAMGTQLQIAGLSPGACGEAWNVEFPERVLGIQCSYVEAGSDCLITNTFGGCRITLERHGLADRAFQINQAGVQIAREAFGERPGFVLGDIGPFGGFLEPLGDTPLTTVREAFQEQADALVSAGVDAIIIETQVALDELSLAIQSARAAGAPCVIASLAFDAPLTGKDVRTIMGVTPEDAARFVTDAGADVVAMNCGKGIDILWAARIIRRYKSATDLPTMAQPNAGAPVMERGQLTYKQTPAQVAEGLPLLLEAGVKIVGGCCGSTPAHIAALRSLIKRECCC
jgi:5-methyltetrahydrofolate--homocysteine methyltransferase